MCFLAGTLALGAQTTEDPVRKERDMKTAKVRQRQAKMRGRCLLIVVLQRARRSVVACGGRSSCRVPGARRFEMEHGSRRGGDVAALLRSSGCPKQTLGAADGSQAGHVKAPQTNR